MSLMRPNTPSDSDLDAIEDITGQTLSDTMRKAYARLAGYRASGIGVPFAVNYPDGTESDDLLQRFLLAKDIQAQWPYVGYLYEFVSHFDLGPEFVDPDVLLPFADCAGGGIYLVNSGQHEGKFFYADNGDFGIALIAPNADEFEKLFNFAAP